MGFGLFETFIGYKVLDSLGKANESMTKIEESKTKLMIDVKRFYTDNHEFFGPDYVTLINEELDLIKSMNIKSSSIIVDDVKCFINEMEFHLIATTGFKEIINTIKRYPRNKLKPGFLETCIAKYNRIINSCYPKDTMEYWEDFIAYLYTNNVHIENSANIRSQLINKMNEL